MRRFPRLGGLAVSFMTAAVLVAAAVPAAAQARPSRLVPVATSAELAEAVRTAQPGDVIQLADGEYRGETVATVPGTAEAPITLRGSAKAVLVNDWFEQTSLPCPAPGAHSAYGLWLYGASHWRVQGITIAHSKKGIVVDRSTDVIISGVTVYDIQEEGVHFRASTTDSAIIGSRIYDTGVEKPGIGEGVYIGSAFGNWRCYGEAGAGTPDRSDRVRVIGNRFGPGIAAEHIDIKEGTVSGSVIGNVFDGRGLSGENSADSWLDIKGSFYEITGNRGSYSATPGSVFANGYETHEQYGQGYGCGNVFTGNYSDLGGVGSYAFYITNQPQCAAHPNVVRQGNFVVGATVGVTNIEVG